MNDMSLFWGGLFDDAGTWYNVHNGHRIGTSVDINKFQVRDVDTQTALTAPPSSSIFILPHGGPSGVMVSKEKFIQLCDSNGGAAWNEGNYHCEWRGRL